VSRIEELIEQLCPEGVEFDLFWEMQDDANGKTILHRTDNEALKKNVKIL